MTTNPRLTVGGFLIFGILKNIAYICDKSSLPWNIQKI